MPLATLLIQAFYYAPIAPQCPGQCPLARASPLVMLAKNRNVSSSRAASSNSRGADSDAEADDAASRSRSKLRNRLGFGSLAVAGGGGAAVIAANRERILPVVLLHGILSNAQWMEEAADWVHAALGWDTYVRCIEIGNGEVDSIVRPLEWQLTQLARELQSDTKLRHGFHLIAHSQGTLLARAFVQRYDWPQVETLVSWVGPQAGQFGVPAYEPLLGYLNRVTSGMWYAPGLQSQRSSSRTLSFAQYWRDP